MPHHQPTTFALAYEKQGVRREKRVKQINIISCIYDMYAKIGIMDFYIEALYFVSNFLGAVQGWVPSEKEGMLAK